MKSAVFFVLFLGSALGQFDQYVTPGPAVNRVPINEQAANTVSYVNQIFPDGSYKYAFSTDTGIGVEAQGTPKAFNTNPPVAPVVATGSFSWYAPDGTPVGISYIADENGYQPNGDAIPTPPPVPLAIQKALDFIARNARPQQN